MCATRANYQTETCAHVPSRVAVAWRAMSHSHGPTHACANTIVIFANYQSSVCARSTSRFSGTRRLRFIHERPPHTHTNTKHAGALCARMRKATLVYTYSSTRMRAHTFTHTGCKHKQKRGETSTHSAPAPAPAPARHSHIHMLARRCTGTSDSYICTRAHAPMGALATRIQTGVHSARAHILCTRPRTHPQAQA